MLDLLRQRQLEFFLKNNFVIFILFLGELAIYQRHHMEEKAQFKQDDNFHRSSNREQTRKIKCSRELYSLPNLKITCIGGKTNHLKEKA